LEKIPVIIVISDDQPETALKAKETGALALVIKPPSIEELEKILGDLDLIPSKKITSSLPTKNLAKFLQPAVRKR
jgi:CheY-like chemotaxis protein